MKVIKKTLFIFLTLLLIGTFLHPTVTYAYENTETNIVNSNAFSIIQKGEMRDNNIAFPQADDTIKWYYKLIDGKLYQRQFNHTTGKWLGEWELC